MKFLSTLTLSALLLAFANAQDAPKSVVDRLKAADAEIARIIAIPASERTFENTIVAFDELSYAIDRDLSLGMFLQNVSPDAKVRDDARAGEEYYSNWGIDLSKREDLFLAIKAFADTHPTLAGEDKRLLDHTMRDYRRSGMDLPKEQRDKLADIEKQLTKLGVEFEQNIAEDQTKFPATSKELAGVPQEVLDRVPKFDGTYLLGLDGPTYGAIMDYCSVDATRQKIQWLYRRRGGQKNVQVLEKMLPLRAEEAKMLGFKNSVDYAVETRMAKNSATIKKFYDDLVPLINKKAKLDLAEFQAAKQKMTKDPKAVFKPWDYSFVKNYLMRTKYAVDGQKVAEYFPMQGVVKGLFAITERLYGVQMKDVTTNAESIIGMKLWDKDVQVYEFVDKATGKPLGHMITDLYPRDNKYSHAACWPLQPRHNGALPLCTLVCNFSKPSATKPSLLPHDEVETFFHEFGHGLHSIFSDTKYARFAGTGVARDFVEAPSQMMENWVWDPQVLRLFAKHYKTGATIPDSLLKGMQGARQLGSGIETQGQIYLGMMDQTFHLAPNGKIDTTKAAWDIQDKYTSYKHVPETFYQASFGHLVGYNGAYYGYLWSLVYAQDMFQRFEELGVLSPKTGDYYRTKVLAKGGSIDEFEMLRGYLGRDPKVDAFLKHLGLKK